MSGLIGIPFGLSFAGFEFGAVETILLVTAVATAVVSLVKLIRLSSRERLRAQVAKLHCPTVLRTGLVRVTPVPRSHQGGSSLGRSALAGTSEQCRRAA